MIRRLGRNIGKQLLNRAGNVVAEEATKALMPHVQDATAKVMDAMLNPDEKVRSTGGATSKFMTQIMSDFNDFHADAAESDIQTFVLEYIDIQFGKQSDFQLAKTSDKIKLNVIKKVGRISDVRVNQIAISNYVKSLNSATITYRVSAGFEMGGSRRERLYEVEYTLQLRDEYGEQQFLQCDVCGAPLEEATGHCKYCGTKHIRDTISHWVITDVKEK
ncbi:MAG: hypothetical protein IJ419_07845 [Agathobacter sp.]|nr:hypothetical protein [Agathobacter sp.]